MIQPFAPRGEWLVPKMSSNEACESGCSVPDRFNWSQRRVNGSVMVQLSGELDVSVSDELDRRLTNVVESDAAVVVLDLWDLTFIDAHSVGLIVAAHAAVRQRGRHLRVDGLRGVPARVFELLGLEPLKLRRPGQDTARRDTRERYGRAHRVALRQRSAGGTHEAG
jgi:anti-anti-sigma factor